MLLISTYYNSHYTINSKHIILKWISSSIRTQQHWLTFKKLFMKSVLKVRRLKLQGVHFTIHWHRWPVVSVQNTCRTARMCRRTAFSPILKQHLCTKPNLDNWQHVNFSAEGAVEVAGRWPWECSWLLLLRRSHRLNRSNSLQRNFLQHVIKTHKHTHRFVNTMQREEKRYALDAITMSCG